MPNAFKQYEAKGTVLLKGWFQQAQIRLTLLYVAILAAILFISGGITYSLFSNQLLRRFDGIPPRASIVRTAEGFSLFIDRTSMPDTRPLPNAAEVKADLVGTLIAAGSILLAVGGLASYWLAGLTLHPIQAAYDRQKRFMGDASHELRTPLAILQIDLENELASGQLKANDKQRAKSQLEEVQRMGSLIGSLLSLSRLDESDGTPLHKQEIELVSYLSRAVDRLQGLAKEKQVAVKFESSLERLVAQTDPALLSQILDNLLKNAIFYNKKEGLVTLSLAREAGRAVIIVEDTGIGIASEEKEKVFERFYRSDQSRSRETGGSGLGLAIVRAASARLGGALELVSEVEKGTKVVLSLPLS